MSLASIVWDVQPEIFPGTAVPVRWYGLLFALGFFIGYELLKRMFKREGYPVEWTDSALIYCMVGTIIGARLGHVFFYDWAEYKQDPIQILMIWKGGLASHGAVIGIITAMYFLNKQVIKKSVLWILDRVVITIAQAGVLIRLGNLMNSEIYGKPTGSDWGFIFVRSDEYQLPRYPTQLMEAAGYLLIFFFLWYAYRKWEYGRYQGRLFGYFLLLIFGVRFAMEFIKENQVAFEDQLPLNMGQWLSIPCMLGGLWFIYRSSKSEQVA
ncbi:MAG TPA: prolipoprotein diacylglyceryl transferase [Luteibaculaceae bacterium]|nr:prolipoprotein diacylglyceryl transferase [Luteibaculaceae bacterium]